MSAASRSRQEDTKSKFERWRMLAPAPAARVEEGEELLRNHTLPPPNIFGGRDVPVAYCGGRGERRPAAEQGVARRGASRGIDHDTGPWHGVHRGGSARAAGGRGRRTEAARRQARGKVLVRSARAAGGPDKNPLGPGPLVVY